MTAGRLRCAVYFARGVTSRFDGVRMAEAERQKVSSKLRNPIGLMILTCPWQRKSPTAVPPQPTRVLQSRGSSTPSAAAALIRHSLTTGRVAGRLRKRRQTRPQRTAAQHPTIAPATTPSNPTATMLAPIVDGGGDDGGNAAASACHRRGHTANSYSAFGPPSSISVDAIGVVLSFAVEQ